MSSENDIPRQKTGFIKNKPLFILSAFAYSTILFLLAKVVPTFGDVFDSFGSKLPPSTAALVAFSRFIERYLPLAMLALLGLLFLTDNVISRRPAWRKGGMVIFALVLALGLGFIVYAMLLPMFDIDYLKSAKH